MPHCKSKFQVDAGHPRGVTLVHPRLVSIVEKIRIQSVGRKHKQPLRKGVSKKVLQRACTDTLYDEYFVFVILLATVYQ